MRLASITSSIISAVLFCTYAQIATAEDKTNQAQTDAAHHTSYDSFYIKLINEKEVVIDNENLSLAELEDYLKNNLTDLEEQHIILYITDTQYVNQAYKLGFDLKGVIGKHIWVTYKPAYGVN